MRQIVQFCSAQSIASSSASTRFLTRVYDALKRRQKEQTELCRPRCSCCSSNSSSVKRIYAGNIVTHTHTHTHTHIYILAVISYYIQQTESRVSHAGDQRRYYFTDTKVYTSKTNLTSPTLVTTSQAGTLYVCMLTQVKNNNLRS